jgi:inosine/xanthosine triphosphate pyrophosphatase family protein
MRRILMATRNRTKYDLIAPTLQRYGFEVITLEGLPVAEVPETGATPLENALAKARRYHGEAYPWVFGQDAGLEIDALNGEPGTQVRRWGGRLPQDIDDESWLNYLLDQMRDVPPEQRTAAFIIARVIIAPDGSEHTNVLRYPFRIATRQLRPIPPGAPLSSVMVGPEDIIAFRADEVYEQFLEWGILEKLLDQFPDWNGGGQSENRL